MKLTQYDRKCIVASILADIPEIDHADTMRKRALAVAKQAAPETVRKLLDGPTAHWVNKETVYCDCMSFRVPAPDYNAARELSAALKADPEFSAAHKAHDDQRDQRVNLRRELEANVGLFTTRKRFIERFPDLAKYAPDDSSSPSTLPATTSLVDHLRAAGMPLTEQAA